MISRDAVDPRAAGLVPSPTLAMNERVRELLGAGRNIVQFGFGESPFPPAPEVVAALRENAARTEYLPVRGLAALREAVADHHRQRLGIEVRADDVLVGPGSKQLMFHLLQALDAEVVLPAPSWVSYEPQAQVLGRPVQWIQTSAKDGWKLRPDQLERLSDDDPDRLRVLVLNTPSNPSGVAYTESDLEGLATILRNRHVLVLADEIYGELHHEAAHVSIAPMLPDQTIISSGLSKWCGAGGWRLGTMVVPRPLRWLADRIAVLASETYSCASAPVQHAAVIAYRGSAEIDAHVDATRRALARIAHWCTKRLRGGGIDVVKPDGGFYLLADLSPFREALAAAGVHGGVGLAERLLEDAGVATLPGQCFGQGAEALTLRIAYVDLDGEAALRNICGDVLEVQVLAPRVVDGIDRLLGWLEDVTAAPTPVRSARISQRES